MKIKKFVRENMAWIFCGPAFLLCAIILTSLYEVRLEFGLYLCSVIFIIEIIVFMIQYVTYKDTQIPIEEHKETKQNLAEEQSWQEAREEEDFFALWAHQIKTPIAALNLLLQSEEQDIPACRNEVFRIEGYVEMALNYLRFEGMSNDLVLSGCDLESMVRQVVKKHASVFIHRHLAVQLEDLNYMILTDEKWFCFVLEQILSNALKYTAKGSVHIFAVQQSEELVVTVEDTGIGIKGEDIPRLFQKGFTGYNGRMDKKASGLGLYLSKGVCDKLGHHIRIESKEKEGTRVMITVRHENVRKADLVKD